MSDHPFHERDAGFGRRLLRVGMAWRRRLDHELRGYNLTDARWRPIFLLGTLTDGPLADDSLTEDASAEDASPDDAPADGTRAPHVRQNELARLLMIDAPSLARLLEALEADGAVRRREDPRDRRGKLVGLTAHGHDLFRRVSGVNASLGEQLLDGIPAADLAAAERVLAAIERALGGDETGVLRPAPPGTAAPS